jgi:dUTP pyrophosphatase
MAPIKEELVLKVKLLHSMAKLPEVAHPGQDLGYDIFCLEDAWVGDDPLLLRTGIAVEMKGYGFLIRDRSSMAQKGVFVTGGVIDEGYRGEVKILLNKKRGENVRLIAGQKIAQLIPIRPATRAAVVSVAELSVTERGEKGFGSTGK